MQARIALMLRPVVIWITQAVVTGVAFWIIDKMFDGMLNQIKEHYGLSDDDTRIVIANNLLEAATFIGVGATVMAKKIPINLAKKLGFANGNVTKRVLSKEATAKIIAKDGAGAAAKITGKVITEVEAKAIIETAIKSKKGFKEYYLLVATTLTTVFLGMMAVGGWIDFGNWNSGAYQKSMQKFLAWITGGLLVPDEDYRKSLTISDVVFTKVYNTFKLGGALGIQDPYKEVEVPFTRENLLDLTDQVGSSLMLANGSASAKNVLTAVLPMIIFDANADVDKAIANLNVVTPTTTTQATTTQTTKVFTGIVSQGVVGEGLVFESRPDDLIQSIDELRSAAANNLAPFLQSLLGKIVYEVRIVSSILTKDGFKQSGTSQRIQTGTNSKGVATYKTVTNKFATLIVYALTDKGSRAKLTTIVLGPTDSSKITVGTNDVRTLETQLPSIVTTTDINAITGISTASPITVTTPPQALVAPVVAPTPVVAPVPTVTPTDRVGNAGYTLADLIYFRNQADGTSSSVGPNTFVKRNGQVKNVTNGTFIDLTTGNFTSEATVTPVPSTAPVVATPTKLGLNATTLSEWYTANNKSLPSVSERSQIYANLGLGQASYYTGTAEQNTKLLNALKA